MTSDFPLPWLGTQGKKTEGNGSYFKESNREYHALPFTLYTRYRDAAEKGPELKVIPSTQATVLKSARCWYISTGLKVG